MRTPLLLATLLFLGGCAHSEPDATNAVTPPPGTGSWPLRLTYNMYDDRQPSWLPDGSGILYSTERGDQQRDKDRCIALVPADGGPQRWRRCQTDGRFIDTTDVWEWPSMGPGGRTLLMKTTGWNHALKLGFPWVSIADGFDFEGAAHIRRLPFFTDTTHQIVYTWTYRWMSRTDVAFLGVLQFWEGETFAPDTFFTGEQILTLHLSGDTGGTFAVVPGTDYASSVAVDGDSTALYYTLGGDSLVYRRHLLSGVVDTVHNFGSGRVVRDVSVRGNTLVGVVGQSVVFQFETAHGWVQRDEGGDIAVVDLSTGAERLYTAAPDWLFRHPEISPDGTRLVVEVQPFAYAVLGPTKDYDASNHRADLWLFSLEDPPLAP